MIVISLFLKQIKWFLFIVIPLNKSLDKIKFQIFTGNFYKSFNKAQQNSWLINDMNLYILYILLDTFIILSVLFLILNRLINLFVIKMFWIHGYLFSNKVSSSSSIGRSVHIATVFLIKAKGYDVENRTDGGFINRDYWFIVIYVYYNRVGKVLIFIKPATIKRIIRAILWLRNDSTMHKTRYPMFTFSWVLSKYFHIPQRQRYKELNIITHKEAKILFDY